MENFMNQMNQIVVEGNVVRDSLVKETARGTKVCVVPIATNRYYKDASGDLQKDTAFFDVHAWGDNFSRRIVSMAKKGRGLRVVGRLKQDRWKGSDGKSLSKVYIIAEHIDFQHEVAKSKNPDESKEDASLAARGMMAESAADLTEDDFSVESETVF